MKKYSFLKETFRLLCVLFMVIVSYWAQAQDLIPTLLDQGLKLYASQDYRGAADYLGQVVDMAPEHDQARFYLIYSLSLSSNREKALEHALTLSSRHPTDTKYIQIISQLRSEIAAETARKNEQTRQRENSRVTIVGGYQSLDNVKKPRVSTQTYNIKPPRPKTKLEQAVEKMDEQDYEAARNMLNEIISKNPKEAQALHYLGVISFNASKYQEAADEFNKAIAIDPRSFQTHFLMADCFRAMDDLNRAEESLKKALAIKEDVFAMLNMADVKIRKGQMKEAEEIYNKILAKDPEISDALIGLAQIKLSRGFKIEAAETVNEVIAKGMSNPEAHYTRAKILMSDNLFDDAAEEVKRAMTILPGNLKYRTFHALCMVRGYKVTTGFEEASVILQENPESIEARLVVAEALILSGAMGDAQEHLDKIEEREKHPQVSRLRYLIAKRNNEKDKVQAYMQEYVERSAGQPGPALEYAQMLESDNRNDEALRAFYEISEAFSGTGYAQQAQEGIERLKGIKGAAEGENRNDKSGFRPGKVKF